MNKTKISTIVGLLFIAIVALGATKCEPKEEDRWGDQYDGIYRNKFTKKDEAVTPLRMRVESNHDINPASLPEFDVGATTLFEIVRRSYPQYTNALTHDFYRVIPFPRSSYCITPGFAIPGGWNVWDQHPDFDKDPREGRTLICAAGVMFGENGWLLVDDASIWKIATQYEAEHIVLYWNDRPKFIETMGVHAHPLLPDLTPGVKAETSDTRFTAWMFELPQDMKVYDLTVTKGTKVCILLTK